MSLGGVCAALALAVAVVPAATEPFIEVRFSVKVILDPVTGERPRTHPAPGAAPITNPDVESIFEAINRHAALMPAYQRGYRFVVDEIVDIGGICPSGCSSNQPGFWYGRGFPPPKDSGSGLDLEDFEDAARDNQSAFQWKANAVNLYLNWGQGNGAVASFPPPDLRSNHVVVAGSQVLDSTFASTFAASIVAHELGHYFGLAHTNGGACKADSCYTVNCPNPVPTDGDGLADTLPDDPCYTLDALCVHHFGTFYQFLLPHQQKAIDDIYWNNMSYLHPGQTYGQAFMDRRTEDQLDRFADIASFDTSRTAVRTGRSWTIATTGSLGGTGRSTSPFLLPSQGHSAAQPGDILLFKPGSYAQNLLFNRPCIVRVARYGTAIIGQ